MSEMAIVGLSKNIAMVRDMKVTIHASGLHMGIVLSHDCLYLGSLWQHGTWGWEWIGCLIWATPTSTRLRFPKLLSLQLHFQLWQAKWFLQYRLPKLILAQIAGVLGWYGAAVPGCQHEASSVQPAIAIQCLISTRFYWYQTLSKLQALMSVDAKCRLSRSCPCFFLTKAGAQRIFREVSSFWLTLLAQLWRFGIHHCIDLHRSASFFSSSLCSVLCSVLFVEIRGKDSRNFLFIADLNISKSIYIHWRDH